VTDMEIAEKAIAAGFISPLESLDPERYAEEQQAWADIMSRESGPNGAPHPASFGPTEDGLARALVAHFGDQLRYCPQRGKWLHWEGHRWRWDEAEIHRELIRGLGRQLPEDKEWSPFRRRAMSAAGVTGIARLAQSDSRVVAHFADLDGDPWALNTPAGIVNLRTGELEPSDPARLCTRSTLCRPASSLKAERWEEFLTDTFGEDAELTAYLRRLVGYSAVGMVGPHVLPFCFGSGGNGKGVFLEALAGVLGDYATTAPVGFLMAQQYAGHETEIARLAGSRMVICSEVNEEDRFDEAKVKQLTGGDTLTARFMRQDHFTFTPSHQLWLMGNHKPAVRSGGRSFWRRLRLVPFVHEVPEEKVVEDLQGTLVRDHGPELLAWVISGAVEYAAAGLLEPGSVKAATAEYAQEQDTVAQFVASSCRVGGGDHVAIKISKLREVYEQWCHAEGQKPVSAKALGIALERRFNVSRPRQASARLYGNISLLAEEDGGWGDD
jgi:putative DNA primase/helicase